MNFVLDGSVALSWCLPDESTPVSRALLQSALDAAMFVPPVWPVEVSNILGLTLKKGRLSAAGLEHAKQLFSLLDLRVEPSRGAGEISILLELMKTHRLTAYDASYLEIAYRRQLPLATFDNDLAAAAKALGLSLLLETM